MGIVQYIASLFSSRSLLDDSNDHHVPQRSSRTLSMINTTFRTSHVPMEVVLQILEAAYFTDILEPDVQLLRSCALVCKDWSEPAQKLLFRHVSLSSESAFRSFSCAVNTNTVRGRALAENVARLRVTIDVNQPDQLHSHSFAQAVILCPYLYELDVSLYGPSDIPQDGTTTTTTTATLGSGMPPLSFDDTTLSLLRTGPRISALRFSNWSSINDGTAFQQLSDIWPSLSSVILKGIPPRLISRSAEPGKIPLMPIRCNFIEARMSFQTAPSVDVVKWLLRNSEHSLRVLEFERDPTQEVLDYLMRRHCGRLESLYLPTCSSPEHAAFVSKCAQLKEFVTEGPRFSPLLVQKLPKGLEHLAIAISKDSPLHYVLNTVKDSDSLRSLTVHCWDGGLYNPLLPSLKVNCAFKGIELVLTTNIQQFRATIRADPIPTPTFPRVKSTANLLSMVSTSRTLSAQEYSVAGESRSTSYHTRAMSVEIPRPESTKIVPTAD